MTKFRLINIKSKFRKLLILLPLFALLNACDKGCVESYQFDSENTYVNSKPTSDGIFGGPYNNTSGGENASWHQTGLRSDGGQLVLEIRGSWTAWEDGIYGKNDLESLPECTICAKRSGVDNCICKVDEVSVPEKDTFGVPKTGVDCSEGSDDQNDSLSCSCTNAHGTINDFGTYFIATNYQEKSEALKLPDNQNPCRYTAGLGLYVGLFGKNGNTVPLRVYQVFPTQKICDITTTVEGKCIDDSGNDQTKYVYKSPNGKTFIKDDKSGNNGTDTNTADDEYHQPGEFIKFIINDRYYQDNFGGYDVNFMGGFFRDHDSGLLEYIVGSVEDIVLGKVSDNGKREGGAIEFLYNSIVKDSTFIRIVQMCLIMYVVLFGIYVLAGGIQISNKEISKRVLKIALVIFFTTEASWYFYNQLVVGLFKDGMDAVITIFMNSSDKVVDQTSLIITSQLDRASSVSYATRFSYVDEVIKKLLSASTSKKIWSLFFGEWFGLIYIPAIYALIFAFVYIMLTAALVYITALLRLVFVLCLGPIFMVTVLFNKTDEIFKRWLSFMASQSIQMISLFLVLYLFVVLIDVNFNNLLSYRACTENINFGLFNINFMKSHSNRGLVEWVMLFAKIGALLFLLKMIMEKIPGFAGHLVSIGGQAADTSNTFVDSANKSAFGLAKGVMGMAASAAGTAITKGVPYALSKGLDVARATGANKLIPPNPIGFASGMYRDHKINNIINAKQKEGKALGKAGKDLDAFVRKGTFDEINKQMSKNGNKLNILGVNDHKAIQKRLDKKLVEDPLKKAIKDETSKMKKECLEKGTKMPLSKAELNAALKPRIAEWAKKNSSIGESTFLNLLEDQKYSSLVKKHGSLTSDQAAKMFAGNEEGTNRYLLHLQNRQFEKEKKRASETKLGKLFRVNKIKDAARGLQRSAAYNPKMARENFLRKKDWEEKRLDHQDEYTGLKKGLNAIGVNVEKSSISERINVIDKLNRRSEIDEMVREAETKTLAEYLKNGYQDDIIKIETAHEDATKGLDQNSSAYSQANLKKDSELAVAQEKKDAFEEKLAKTEPEVLEAVKEEIALVGKKSSISDKLKGLRDQKSSIQDQVNKLKSQGSLSDEDKAKLSKLESEISTMDSSIAGSEVELSDIESKLT
jgi:type IV secretory pathway VirB6-like protein